MGIKTKALRAAFPFTVPIFAGFTFLGAAYGIFMKTQGFPFWLPPLMAAVVFAGSMEFVAVTLLTSAANPFYAFALTLMVNARHLFYGISMLDKYRGVGKKKWYLVFGMCDETFSILCSAQAPHGVDRGWFMFFVTFLNHCYWVFGAALGGLIGAAIPFNTRGLDFVMTALFVVIFLEQWKGQKRHLPALAGLGLSAVSLLLFGADNFILPAMALILAVLTILRKPLEKGASA